jgi:AcrR family transcriptional regulator
MMKTTNKAATKDQLLDVAERHFATYGFAGTSLRGIIREAKVNVAAVAYHYGSKEELFSAVMQRFAIPVVSEQLRLLEEIDNNALDLGSILTAFYTPPVRLLKSKGVQGETLALFLGRAQTEPEPIFSLVDQHYAPCRSKFIEAFRGCMPDASEADQQWNFEFMLSLIVCFLTRQAPIRKRYGDTSLGWTTEQAIERMVAFCQSGMARSSAQ